MRRAHPAVLTILGVVTSLALTAPAWALDRGSLMVTDTTVRAGNRVTVYGWGCPDRAMVQPQLDGRPIQEVLAGKDGRFSTTLTVPPQAKHGQSLVVTAQCESVTLSFQDCPDQAPTALLDGKRMTLTLDRADRGNGFIARAVIPRKTVSGRYQLSAGCDVDAFGDTEIQVLDPASPEAVTTRNAFGVRTGSDLAIWVGAFAGMALLVASIGSNWRGRA
jgi:hypothetical protein